MAQRSLNTQIERPFIGIALMVLGMSIIPLLDVCAKLLNENYPVLQVTWARFAFHLVFLIILLSLRKQRWWQRPLAPKTQIIRSLFLLLATLCFFTAIKTTPIPNAIALIFISPLIVTLLSPIFLGESFHWSRLTAVITGFIGVLIVLQPTTEGFNPQSLFALAAGASYALYLITTRKLSQQRTPLLTLFYTAVAGAIVMTVIVPFVWVSPDLKSWGLMALMGLAAATGHFFIIRAFDYAAASLLAPFNYAEIIMTTLLSYWLFNYFPTPTVWLGIAIIIASGIYSSLQEYRKVNEGQIKT